MESKNDCHAKGFSKISGALYVGWYFQQVRQQTKQTPLITSITAAGITGA
jgi:hypothetical protein